MKYLIIPIGSAPFLTNWFDVESNYLPGWIVVDLDDFSFYNGEEWHELRHDNL